MEQQLPVLQEEASEKMTWVIWASDTPLVTWDLPVSYAAKAQGYLWRVVKVLESEVAQ